MRRRLILGMERYQLGATLTHQKWPLLLSWGGRLGALLPEGETVTGSQLDEHHAPETNGRMSVCRRCGSQTDSPAGQQHMPTDRQMAVSV